MEGYLIKINGMDVEWIPYVLEQALFAIANNDAGIDHWAHLGGFVFGFIYKDFSCLYLSQEWFNFYNNKVTSLVCF